MGRLESAPRADAADLVRDGESAMGARSVAPIPQLLRSAAATLAGNGGIRPCEPEDIPQVAQIFQNSFRSRRRTAPASLEAYFKDLLLSHPWSDPEIRSLVHVDGSGKVGGFIGVLPVRLRLEGRSLRGAVAGSLAVDDARQNPLAGARLLRSFLAGPQDISISESANDVSIRMWERLGHRPLFAYSMDWLRVFRPAGFAVAALGEWHRWSGYLAPLGRLADRLGNRLSGHRLRPEMEIRGGFTDVGVGDDQLIPALQQIAGQFSLRPDWDQSALAWILAHADSKKRHGKTFKRVVFDKADRPVGCYIYYGRPGGVAWVLQVLALPAATSTVVDCLLRHAFQLGCVAVKGRSNPHINDVLIRRRALFFSRSSTVVHSDDQDILSAIRSQNALFTGLAGEAWTRLIGDEFS